MKCPSCGYENKEGAKACNLCGAVLRKSESPSDSNGGNPFTAPKSATSDDIFPNPTAYTGETRKAPVAGRAATPAVGASEFDHRQVQEAQESKHALRWIAAAAGLIVVGVVIWAVARMPYSSGKVDRLYAAYVQDNPVPKFPEYFTHYQGRRKENADYIFQFCRAYERTFVERNPFADVEDQTAERLAAVNAGQPDPGFQEGSSGTDQEVADSGGSDTDYPATDDKALQRISNVEAVTNGLYGTGSKPFGTLRSLAGGDERGREMRELQGELVMGRKEEDLRRIEVQHRSRVQLLQGLQQKTREELKYFLENGTPKQRSIASRMNERLFPPGK